MPLPTISIIDRTDISGPTWGLFDSDDAANDNKPKRKRKPADHSKLVLRTGRLTPAFWMLKEGLDQDIRKRRQGGTGENVFYDWQVQSAIGALESKGWIEQVKGPRGGVAYRTTGDGALAMAVAEGVAARIRGGTFGKDST